MASCGRSGRSATPRRWPRLNKRYTVTVDGSASVEEGAWDGPVAGADACRAPGDAIELAVNGTPLVCDHNAWRPHGLLYTLYASRRMRGLPFGCEREDDADAAEGAVQDPPDLLRLGRNELTITVRKRREDAGPLLITGIEALINYDGGE